MMVFLARFNGHYLEGQVIVLDETKRRAFNRVKKEIAAMGLASKNEDFSIHNLELVYLHNKDVILIDNGDY